MTIVHLVRPIKMIVIWWMPKDGCSTLDAVMLPMRMAGKPISRAQYEEARAERLQTLINELANELGEQAVRAVIAWVLGWCPRADLNRMGARLLAEMQVPVPGLWGDWPQTVTPMPELEDALKEASLEEYLIRGKPDQDGSGLTDEELKDQLNDLFNDELGGGTATPTSAPAPALINNRTADETVVSAVTNTMQAALDALDGLAALLGARTPGRVRASDAANKATQRRDPGS